MQEVSKELAVGCHARIGRTFVRLPTNNDLLINYAVSDQAFVAFCYMYVDIKNKVSDVRLHVHGLTGSSAAVHPRPHPLRNLPAGCRRRLVARSCDPLD